ncbi:MAG: hypothetical protein ACLFQB_13970 [Chitinispirillaceae bacterium]
MNRIFRAGLIFFLLLAGAGADSNTRTVKAEFSRCESTLKRVKREIGRYEEVVKELREVLREDRRSPDCNPLEISDLQSRLDYFQSRIERTEARAEKIREDIGGVKGPTCPSCVLSSVNLYCRHCEHLSTMVAEYHSKAASIRNRIRQSSAAGGSETDSSHTRTLESFENAVSSHQKLINKCESGAGRALFRQCRTNLRAADSLFTEGKAEDSREALDLSRMLLEKAVQKCKTD